MPVIMQFENVISPENVTFALDVTEIPPEK